MGDPNRVAILVPVLRRPHRVEPLARSVAHATRVPYRLLFIPDPGDAEEIEALESAGQEFLPYDGGYAAKINAGVRATDEPYVFFGADDLNFHEGWFATARNALGGDIHVAGVNDLLPRQRQHATHFLVTRQYVEWPLIDGRHGPLCEDYHHWYCDDEFIATAAVRGAYAYVEGAVVQHLHPQNGSAPDDDIYELGRSNRQQDRRRFIRRAYRWT